MVQNASRDQNDVPTLLGVSMTDGTPVTIYADPSTHRLLVDANISPSSVLTETPVGAINSSNKVYTVSGTISGVFTFNINGQYIHPAEYSTAGSTITFVTALDSSLSGTGFTIVYF